MTTKNAAHEPDSEMHLAKKGNEWHFGMKAHVGADADSGLVHSVHATAANESEIASTLKVLHNGRSLYRPMRAAWASSAAQALRQRSSSAPTFGNRFRAPSTQAMPAC